MSEMTKEKVFTPTIIVCLLASCLTAGNTSFNVLLSSLAAEFPNASPLMISLMGVFPNLFGIGVPLILGAFVGRKIGYKPVMIACMILYVIGGCGPILFHSSYLLLLVFRGLYGIGVAGLAIRLTIIIIYYKDLSLRSRVMGYSLFVSNIAGVILSPVVGVISDKFGVFPAFGIFAIGIIPLVITVLMFEDPYDKAKAAGELPKEEGEKKAKGKFRPVALFYIIFNGVCMLLQMQYQLNISFWVEKCELGTAAQTGIILSMFTVGGMVGGLLCGNLFTKTKRFSYAIYGLMMTVGMALVYFIHSIPVFCIGGFLVGFAVTGYSVATKICYGATTDATTVNFANGLSTACGYGGLFLSAFLTPVFYKIGGDVSGSFICSAVILAVITIAFFVVNPLPREIREQLDSDEAAKE